MLGAAVSKKGYDVRNSADRFKVFSTSFRSLKIHAVHSLSTTIPAGTDGEFTANATTDTITATAHGLPNGAVVNFLSNGSLPGGITAYPNEFYYVINQTTNTFQISLTSGGSAVDITSTGSGTHLWFNDTNILDINHGFGYYAPCLVAYNGSSTIGTESSFLMSQNGAPLDIQIHENKTRILVTSTFDLGFSSVGDTVYFTTYQFIDDLSTYEAPIINTNTNEEGDSDSYGLRVSKDGFDVKKCADSDCVVSSSFFTKNIQKRGSHTASSSGRVNINHNLNYIPSFVHFKKFSGENHLTYSPAGDGVSETQASFLLDSGTTVYYIIFK